MTELAVPVGGRFVPLSHKHAADAVREYDSELALGQMESTGDWVVFLERGSGDPPFPVFNLGRELPAPEEIKRRLYMADVRRRGREIVRDIDRHNDAVKKELRERAHQGAVETAEYMEYVLRRMGVRPKSRIFVPGKD